jgi:hypothetical protein
VATAVDIAVWGAHAGWSGAPPATNLTTAVAVALATGADPSAPKGLYGIGGGGDGQSQSVAAHAEWVKNGWASFPGHKAGAWLLYVPIAQTAVLEAPLQNAVQNPGSVIAGVGELAKSLPGADLLDQAKNALTLAYKGAAWLGNSDNWVRVLLVVLGGGMVVGGVYLAAQKPIDASVGAVGKVAGVAALA